MLAAKRNPKETGRAKYEMISTKRSKGSNANGQPAGTNKEKNSSSCLYSPNRVAPKTIVKLRENVTAKCAVEAKL